MDSSKLVNWRILTNNIDYGAEIGIVSSDLSNAAMIFPLGINMELTACNISDAVFSSITSNVLIYNSNGNIKYYIPYNVNSSNTLQLSDCNIKNSEFIFPLSSVGDGASNYLFSSSISTNFSGSKFKQSTKNDSTSGFNLSPLASDVMNNNFTYCSFENISLIDTGSLGGISGNNFDNSSFYGYFNFSLTSDNTDQTSNTFRNCTFDSGGLKPQISSIETNLSGINFAGSKFGGVTINMGGAILENCQFFNCVESDGITPLTSAEVIAMALPLTYEWSFQLNGKTYIVPAD
jgi:hypothetical protein